MLSVSIFGIAVSAALGVLIGVSPFDAPNAAGPSSSAAADSSPPFLTAVAPDELDAVSHAAASAPIPSFPDFTDAADWFTADPIPPVPLAAAPPAHTEAEGAPADHSAGAAHRDETVGEAQIRLEASTERVDAPAARIVDGVLERGDTLARSLERQGVGARVVHRIAKEMAGHYNFRHSQPGHAYRLVLTAEDEVEYFLYRVSPIIRYELSRDAEGRYAVARDETDLWPRQTMVAGIVTSSLYGAITDLGASPQLASDFSEVFAYDVDFSRSIRAGDEFRILYEELYRSGENGEEIFVRPGRILAARYAGASGEHTAVYFETEEGRGGYYRPDGSTVQRAFLMSPVRYARVTSSYSAARRHPILKITRPHQGIDYAAPSGTPVFAVAAGEVIYNSRAGGFGNLVKVRHDGGYVTYYGHLSRFADGLRVGQRVSQKQVIGYVGSTGLSTGPHVCFRVAKDGKYVNPIQLPAPARPPLPEQFKPQFQVRRDTLLASLDSGRLVAADEAL